LLLKAGTSHVSATIPIQQIVKAGDGDNFEFRLATDRSAHFELAIELIAVGGARVRAGDVSVDLFVPRSDADAGLHRTGCASG
jgi:hypothetical protein